MDIRKALDNGREYELEFLGANGSRRFIINDEIGRGGSCIVYEVKYSVDDKGNWVKGVLKEYYPYDIAGIKRAGNSELLVPEAIKDIFEIKKEKFYRGFKLQTELKNTDEALSNSIFSAIDRFKGNGTEYMLMTRDNGYDFENVKGLSLYETVNAIYDFSKILKLVHEEGYLMLDIKPENIFLTLNGEVRLFDFDSFKKKDEIAAGFISSSVGWSTPEVINYAENIEDNSNPLAAKIFLKSINERSDFYSIGRILMNKILGIGDVIDLYIDKKLEIFKGVNYEIFGKLQEFFDKTLDRESFNRYRNDDELVKALEELTRLANPNEMFINYYRPYKDKNAAYRDREIKDLHSILSNNNSAFITAIGGIGKSELAKMYADRFHKEYDIIQFLNYAGSMEDTARRISVNGIDINQAKDKDWLYNQISDLLDRQNNKTLIVVDNFDAEAKDIELLANRKNVKVIFTSRLDINKLYNQYSDKVINLKPLSDEDCIKLFCSLYKDYNETELPIIKDIIRTVNKNTLVVRLIALEMQEQGIEGKEILKRLRNADVKNINGEIFHNEEYRELYAHLLAVFNLAQFDDDMRLILLKMSLVPYIYKKDIKEWLEEDNFNNINRLKNRGWIEYEEETNQYSLHPVISMLSYEEMERWQECDGVVGKADGL